MLTLARLEGMLFTSHKAHLDPSDKRLLLVLGFLVIKGRVTLVATVEICEHVRCSKRSYLTRFFGIRYCFERAVCLFGGGK
jgi:hypothetical protein